MFLPLYDGHPIKHVSLHWVTLALIGLNIVVFGLNYPFLPADGSAGSLSIGLGHVPSVSNDVRSLPVEYQYFPDSVYFLTAITYAFIHADIWHLGGNMLFLWVFGDNVEDAMGHIKYLLFYLIAAIGAAWFHVLVFPDSDAPLIGASGAAAAIVAAYLMLHPKVKIWGLVLGRIPLRLPAIWLLGAWVLFQLFMFLTDDSGNISWAANVGGILIGVLLVGVFKRRDVRLFDSDISEIVSEQEPVEIESPKSAPAPKWGRKGDRNG